MKVLVVDDDPVQVALITELVEIFDVDHVDDGNKALAKFKQAHANGEPYELLFMDLMMPGYDGYMLLEAIREYEKKNNLCRLNSVVISGKKVEDGLTDGLNSQCDDYLVKPVDSDTLLRSLENLGLV
jgi:two-component system chemotaxis response regulator CheY